MTTTNRPIRRALVSVFHKEGIEVLANAFIEAGTEVVSTGSTAHRLAELGVPVTEVSEVTGFPESLDGRVKTLDPHIHAGILADMTNPDHAAQLEQLGIKPFDLVVVNLYPFADTVRSGADEAATIEKIDIGGPSMVRGAAKNSATVAIVTDPADYALVAARVADGTGFSLEERRWLAAKAFAHTAAYDATINEWTAKHWPKPASVDTAQAYDVTPVDEAKFPATFTRTWDRAHVLRYGENPHQQAALYLDPLNQHGFAHAEQLGGKPMSYNNYVDADAAWRAVWDFAPQIAVAVVKHNNPCGLAVGGTVAEAHRKAHACDPMSAYGGVIAANSTVTLEMAEGVRPIFTEVIVAPRLRAGGAGAAADQEEEPAHPQGHRTAEGQDPVPCHRRRAARAVHRSDRRHRRRPERMEAGFRRTRGRRDAEGSGVRLARRALREVQRHPAGARQRHRGHRHGPGQPRRLLQPGRGTRQHAG
ncbi:bifunctional purine biosynthesis protein PurH [Bifidobacterium pullorum]|uniref:Bifunctional purine biosynthesis protein PurH n=1 Tax=Bifidobacterium pullorum TaxID=78448 RepID=A0A7V8HRQ8_9BIFI|nr:bifunctional purine biosynthesis protein PurH [Bifidobacterium pullorum]